MGFFMFYASNQQKRDISQRHSLTPVVKGKIFITIFNLYCFIFYCRDLEYLFSYGAGELSL